MSRSASTAVLTEEIYQLLRAGQCNARVKLEVYKDGTYYEVEDLDVDAGIRWTEGGKNEAFANYGLTPISSSINFNVVNRLGVYSTGSGDTKEDRFDINSKIRFSAGYELNGITTESTTSIKNNAAATSHFYYTEYNGGNIRLDEDNTGAASDNYFTDLFGASYDGDNYDGANYSPAGYVVQIWENSINRTNITKFSVTADHSDGTIYYRTYDTPPAGSIDSTAWTNAGSTSNGTETIDIADTERKYIAIAVVYDGVGWDTSLLITDFKVIYIDPVEYIYTSIYRLDPPEFTDPKAPEQPRVICSGWDDWHKAISTEINIETLAAGVQLDTLLKSICDKVGINYTATSIADLSAYSNRTLSAGLDVTTAITAVDLIMQIVNTTEHIMWLEYDSGLDENVLYLQPKPTTASADGAFSYQNYESVGSTKKITNKQLQRISFITDSQVVDAEEQLGTQAYSSTGTGLSITWSGNAIYKRITTDDNDNITFANFTTTPTSINFDITAITGTVTVTVYGNKWDSTEPTGQGEAINIDNMLSGLGITKRQINALVLSTAECKTISEAFMTKYGSPGFEAKALMYPYCNLLHSNNDLMLLWRRYQFNDDLFYVIKQNHFWKGGSNPRHTTSFDLVDSGLDYSDLGSFIYDDIMDWDRGFIWDMGISNPQSTDAEIDAATTIVRNIDFA